MGRIAVVALATVLMSSAAFAQIQGSGDKDKDLTNCPPAGMTTGSAASDAQAVEKSAILPSAENHEKSAAPTVERNGQSVQARTDCPQDASQPKPKD